ncbi:MAG: HIT family protein [Cytophagales bacterium]
MRKPSIFTQIIRGELGADIVAEDLHHIAFLDISPVTKGHVLVVPKKEVDRLFDLADDDLASLMRFAKKVVRGMKVVISCQRIGLHVHGLEVPHAHIHLVPIVEGEPHHFPRSPINCTVAERRGMAKAMRQAIGIHLSTP